MKNGNKRGISLIVLVITIVVMIILAGAIILSLSSSGIIGKANQAVTDTNNSNLLEAANIKVAEYELEKSSGNSVVDLETYVKSALSEQGFTEQQIAKLEITENGKVSLKTYTTYTDVNTKTAPIPDGFTVSSNSKEQTITDGLVIVDGAGNEFVWVPVPDITKFARTTTYDGETITDPGSNYEEPAKKVIDKDWKTEVLLSEENDLTGAYAEFAAMKKSVEKHKGFYIARYEAGKEGTNTLVIKKGADVWNLIVWGNYLLDIGNDGAVWYSRQMYKNSKSVVSTLCYGVQWDAVMNFMKDVPNPTVSGKKYIENSSGMGWYQLGTEEPKKAGTDVGETALNKVKNIYDMAGNVEECTMEIANITEVIWRGGHYYHDGYSAPASYRYNIMFNAADHYRGFRPTLYLK